MDLTQLSEAEFLCEGTVEKHEPMADDWSGFSALFAGMDFSTLAVVKEMGEWKIVRLQCGDMLLLDKEGQLRGRTSERPW